MKQSLWILHVLLVVVCSACQSKDTTVEINNLLQETAEVEKSFEEQGEKIYELEVKDEELYEKIIGLDNKESKEMIAFAKEATRLVEERKKYLEKEKESIEASKTVFMQIEPKIEKMKDTEQKENMEEMYDVMQKRYVLYDELHDKYKHSLEETEELYDLFQESDIHANEMYSQIEIVNDSYEAFSTAYHAFNRKTEKYNELKNTYLSSLEGK